MKARRSHYWSRVAIPLLVCALGCLADGGCGRREAPSPPAEQAGGATASASSSNGSAATVPSTDPAEAAAPRDPMPDTREEPRAADRAAAESSSRTVPAGVQPAVDPALRELVGRYLQSDEQGAFRPQEAAATALERLPPDQIDALWTLLGDPDVAVRRGAAFFLSSQLDPQQPRHLEAFTALLGDPDRTIRGLALAALRQSPRTYQVAQLGRVVPLLDPARELHAEHRATVARWMGQLREDARLALPALVSAARSDSDPRVRGAALVAVSQVAAAEASLPVLVEALADRESSVRLVAAARLRQMDEAAAPAADRLAERLADDDPRVAQAAAEALLRIGPPAVSALSRQLSAPQPVVRRLALTVLAELGPAAAAARTHIQARANDPDPQIRKLAEGILARLPAR
jgi:HEAT repeat protein